MGRWSSPSSSTAIRNASGTTVGTPLRGPLNRKLLGH
jgi:hypothetical protein